MNRNLRGEVVARVCSRPIQLLSILSDRTTKERKKEREKEKGREKKEKNTWKIGGRRHFQAAGKCEKRIFRWGNAFVASIRTGVWKEILRN